MSYELMDHPNFEKYDTSSLRSCGGGGAAMKPSMPAQVAQKFKNAQPIQGFGMTETNAVTTLNSADTYFAKPESCGRPVMNIDMVAFDDNLKKLPVDGVGELAVCGPTIMSHYWNKP